MTRKKINHIITKIQKGQESALSELMQNTMPDAIKIARNIIYDLEFVEDVVQEAFIKVWKNIDKYDTKKGEFHSWFYKIIQNECIDRNRKGKIFESLNPEIDYPLSEGSLENDIHFKLLKSRVLTIALSLPFKQRKVFTLRDIHELSIDEVSKNLEMSHGSVKTNLYLARKKIKEVLEKEEAVK